MASVTPRPTSSFARLRASGHMSPFEHVAEALSEPDESGNFVGWEQYRKTLTGEAIYQQGRV